MEEDGRKVGMVIGMGIGMEDGEGLVRSRTYNFFLFFFFRNRYAMNWLAIASGLVRKIIDSDYLADFGQRYGGIL